MATNQAHEASRYGNLATVAINFHIQTGNPAELDAAVIYARNAAHFGFRALDYSRFCASDGELASRRVRSEYPEAYMVAGVGWCGPQWQDAQALYHRLINF